MNLYNFKDDFEVKVCLADLLDEVTYKQADAICIALDKWKELDKLLSQKAICKNCEWLETHEGKHICGYMAEVYHIEVEVKNLEAQCPAHKRKKDEDYIE